MGETAATSVHGATPTQLHLVRDSGYADRLRAYRVVLDGVTIGEIRNGQSRFFPLAPGDHQLTITIDWCSSNTVTFTAAEHRTVAMEVASSLRGSNLILAMYYALVARSQYLILREAVR